MSDEMLSAENFFQPAPAARSMHPLQRDTMHRISLENELAAGVKPEAIGKAFALFQKTREKIIDSKISSLLRFH
ncbi:MAG: hypothetical protein NC924_04510 [Candidatus Omnitrophica bacterium]|nr:hypothetical protein [Candidatus Omnitrophota bacterium]